MKKNSRRKFIKKTSIVSSGLFIIPRSVLGGNGFTPPSDQLLIASIGSGGKGGDIRNKWAENERVVALCDVHPNGNHGVIKSIKKYPSANFYVDFRELLDKEKHLDAVTISTPDHTHAVIANKAMNRGLHVYVQKPLTHNIEEARILTNTARKMKVVTQMGNQGGSSKGVDKIKEWVDKKLIGNINKVYSWTNRPVWPQGFKMPNPSSDKPKNLNWDLWLGPAPYREYRPEFHPFNWRGWWDYGTGALGDMGCHLMDVPFKALNLKYPTSVECSIGKIHTKMWSADYSPDGCPPSAAIAFNFDATSKNSSNIKFTWMDGGIKPFHPELLPPDVTIEEGGVMIIGEKGVITCGDYGYNPRLYLKGGELIKGEKIKINEPSFGHHRKWVDACKAGFNSKEHNNLTSSFDFSGPLTETVLMGNIAIRSYMVEGKSLRKEYGYDVPNYIGRKKLLWDGEAMKITNFDEANQFVSRNYRKGWELT